MCCLLYIGDPLDLVGLPLFIGASPLQAASNSRSKLLLAWHLKPQLILDIGNLLLILPHVFCNILFYMNSSPFCLNLKFVSIMLQLETHLHSAWTWSSEPITACFAWTQSLEPETSRSLEPEAAYSAWTQSSETRTTPNLLQLRTREL